MNYEELRQRMNSGKLYYYDSEELMKSQMVCLDRLSEYNQLKSNGQKEKKALLKEMLGHIGKNCYIETPFHVSWSGEDVYFGDGVYTGFNLVTVDDNEIRVGNHVMMGPSMVLYSATHLTCPELREKTAQYSLPIRIGDNVWLGVNYIILPGMTVGENPVIGAGSIVTRDIPVNVVVVRTPRRVVREIHEDDRKYYNHEQEIDLEWWYRTVFMNLIDY